MEVEVDAETEVEVEVEVEASADVFVLDGVSRRSCASVSCTGGLITAWTTTGNALTRGVGPSSEPIEGMPFISTSLGADTEKNGAEALLLLLLLPSLLLVLVLLFGVVEEGPRMSKVWHGRARNVTMIGSHARVAKKHT